MVFRTPRGYARNRPQYQEISEGVRPEATAVPMEAWTGLAPVRVDEYHHDPIVLDPGTIVGIATGGLAAGKLFPAHSLTGTDTITQRHHSDGASWGLPTSNKTFTVDKVTGGPVLPLGVIYQPIYSFQLEQAFDNYKRVDNVGVLTDYLIQIPATTAEERKIESGDLVMVQRERTKDVAGASSADSQWGTSANISSADRLLGKFEKWDGQVSTLKYVVGRCFKKQLFATSASAAGTTLEDDVANITLTTAGADEYKSLDKVQTVPGLGLAGSGTAGVPAHLTGAKSSGSGYYSLTILIRL
jgi:hypothetical protein